MSIRSFFPRRSPAPRGRTRAPLAAASLMLLVLLAGLGPLAASPRPAGAAAGGGNKVTVHRFVCPEGTDATRTDQSAYLDACAPATEETFFELATEQAVDTKQTAGGTANWQNLPAGPAVLRENRPPGVGKPVVFCGKGAWQEVVVDATLVYEFAANGAVQITCNWYDVPDPDWTDAPASVVAAAWDCPVGVGPEAGTRADYLAACPTPSGGQRFTLAGAVGPRARKTVAGWVAWDGAGPGEITLSANVAAGSDEPAVFCEKGANRFAAPGGSVRYDLGRGVRLHCDWFNLPAGGGGNAPSGGGGGTGSVTLRTYACPPGLSPVAVAEAVAPLPLLDRCGPAAPTVPFPLDLRAQGGGASLPAAELSTGVYFWADLPFGTYQFGGGNAPSGGEGGGLLTDGTGTAQNDLSVAIGPERPHVERRYYLFQPADVPELGSVELAVYRCATPEDPRPETCDPVALPPTTLLGIAAEGWPEPAYASLDGNRAAWDGLSLGSYALIVSGLAEGGEVAVVPALACSGEGVCGVLLGPVAPDVFVDLFLVPVGGGEGTGSVAAQVFLCANGMGPSSLDPAGCEPAGAGGYDLTLADYEAGREFSTADAAAAGTGFAWSGLPFGTYVVDVIEPAGYDLFVVEGDVVTSLGYRVQLTPEAPAAEIAVYLFPATGNVGAVTFQAWVCPTAVGPDQACRDDGEPIVGGARLFDPDGNVVPTSGHSIASVWGESEPLPFGTYHLDLTGLPVPDGYQLGRVEGVVPFDGGFWLVVVDEANPHPVVSAYLVPSDAAGPPSP